MATTRTGSFPIGFRRGGSPWQKDLGEVIRFAKDQSFEVLDVAALPAEELKQVLDAGLTIGSADLPQPWAALTSEDAAKRRDQAQQAAAYVREAVELGVRNFFCVVLPEDRQAPRHENMDRAVDGFGQLCQAIADTDAHIVLEGYPGGGPHYASLACTPADYRLLSGRVGSDRLGVNFDPSHLVRMGIDPVRFAHEFVDQIHHVHAKDTEILEEELYQHGNLQPATAAEPHGFGAHHWRYTLPGHGIIRWGTLFKVLADAGYKGAVSIELEDENFNGSTEGEQQGLTASRDFLASV